MECRSSGEASANPQPKLSPKWNVVAALNLNPKWKAIPKRKLVPTWAGVPQSNKQNAVPRLKLNPDWTDWTVVPTWRVVPELDHRSKLEAWERRSEIENPS